MRIGMYGKGEGRDVLIRGLAVKEMGRRWKKEEEKFIGDKMDGV